MSLPPLLLLIGERLNSRLLISNSPCCSRNWKASFSSKISACRLTLTVPSAKLAAIRCLPRDQSGTRAISSISTEVVNFKGDN
ncbi:hypothetical protein MGSAQ_002784 [marine sediment metagenome]|uniref:Uncharacterized protein n=1 Tax=marine sediment metagenome TaxID=412755 RepID=A0A1B6NSM4_9ZZZZ